MSVAELQAAVIRVCMDIEPNEADLTSLGDERDRWLLYRSQVRSRLLRLNRDLLPKSLKVLGQERFDELSARWLHEERPRDRIFRQLTLDFAAWADAELCEQGEIEAACTMRYEAARFRVSAAPEQDVPFGDFAFDKPPVFVPTLELVRVEHPVVPKSPKAHGGGYLYAVYRPLGEIGSKTRTMTLLLGAVVSRAMDKPNETLVELIHAASAEVGKPVSPKLAQEIGIAFANLISAGAVLGST